MVLEINLNEVVVENDAPVPQGNTPADTVVYAVGDIHGRDDLLAHLHEAILEDAARRKSRRKVVIYLGDYMSRGPAARQVLERLINHPLPGFRSIYLKGNHEDIIENYLCGDLTWGTHWLNYGGVDALASYGIEASLSDRFDDRRLLELRNTFRSTLPENHAHFLKNLCHYHREGNYIYVHAGLTPGTPVEQCNPKDLMWIRKSFHVSDKDHGGIVVHGHTITDEPEVKANRISIDTGAYQSGLLTCLVSEGEKQWFLQVQGGRGRK